MNATRIAGCPRFFVPLLLGFNLLTPNSFCGQSAVRLEPPDWFAGDAHVHRGVGCDPANKKEMLTPQQLLEMMKTNNLAVISVLGDIGNGEVKYPDKDIP